MILSSTRTSRRNECVVFIGCSFPFVVDCPPVCGSGRAEITLILGCALCVTPAQLVTGVSVLPRQSGVPGIELQNLTSVTMNNRFSSARRSGAWNFRRSEEHTAELQSLMRISYAVFCLKKTH